MKWLIALALIGTVSAQWGDYVDCGLSTVAVHGTCKDPASSRMIVGGWEVEQHELPYQAGLEAADGILFCGGTLINEDTVLTAAHCTEGRAFSDIVIVLGDHRRNDGGNKERIYAYTTNVIIHENWQPLTNNNDISLLKFDPITYTNYILPACRPMSGSSDTNYADTTLLVSGWGTVSTEDPATTEELRAVCVDFINKTACRATNYNEASIMDSMLCAGDVVNGGVDACQGDSGGPLAYKRSGRMEVVGIVSWGNGCAVPNYPGVYADVPYFEAWIDANTIEP